MAAAKKRTAAAAGAFFAAAGAGALYFFAAESAGEERWYSQTQAAAGEMLYAAHCASCHGIAAAGDANWRVRLSDGSFPPPPLNGTAHTWHHSLAVLRRTIERGGAQLGGKMPAFGGKLDEKERDAIIAYLQSLWPEKIYRAWEERAQGGRR